MELENQTQRHDFQIERQETVHAHKMHLLTQQLEVREPIVRRFTNFIFPEHFLGICRVGS